MKKGFVISPFVLNRLRVLKNGDANVETNLEISWT